MSVSLSFKQIIVTLLVSLIAALAWLFAGTTLHLDPWICMWIFGFVLLVLSIAIDGN